nr:MAG TPA: hypothetical protein [Caudoviricetes sp.]
MSQLAGPFLIPCGAIKACKVVPTFHTLRYT